MLRSTIALAGLAASVVAESSSCPQSTTITSSMGGTTTGHVYTTVSAPAPLPTETQTITEWVANATRTITEPKTVYVTSFGQTVTKNLEHTTTSYTGDFTSSSLRPSTSCAPLSSIIWSYDGTKTETWTNYGATVTSTATTTTHTISTEYADSGATTTVTDDGYTTTVTATTGTAASTVTQALKCAPTNLIGTDGIPSERERGALEHGIASYGSGYTTPNGFEDRTGAHRDASACCQACQEDENCSASMFFGTSSTYPAPSLPWCQLFTKDEDSCGLGFTVFTGDKQIAQTGPCGYIAENVYFPGLPYCEEGMTPRECQQNGVGGLIDPSAV